MCVHLCVCMRACSPLMVPKIRRNHFAFSRNTPIFNYTFPKLFRSRNMLFICSFIHSFALLFVVLIVVVVVIFVMVVTVLWLLWFLPMLSDIWYKIRNVAIVFSGIWFSSFLYPRHNIRQRQRTENISIPHFFLFFFSHFYSLFWLLRFVFDRCFFGWERDKWKWA